MRSIAQDTSPKFNNMKNRKMRMLNWIGIGMMSIGLSLFLICKQEDFDFVIKFLLLAGVVLFLIGFYFPKK